MIIFYDKKTGVVKGTIEGRIHNEDHLKMWIGDKEKNGRLVVNWKPIKEKVKIPVKELRVTDMKTGKVEEVTIGSKTEERVKEFVPDCDFPEIIIDFENRTKKIGDYRVRLDKNKKVVGFIKK